MNLPDFSRGTKERLQIQELSISCNRLITMFRYDLSEQAWIDFMLSENGAYLPIEMGEILKKYLK